MKNIINFLILLFPILTFAQDFEGIVHYQMEYTLKNTNVTIEGLEKEMGTKTKSYYKNGFFKEFTNSTYASVIFFHYKENRFYYQNNKSKDTLRFSITNKFSNEKFGYVVYKKALIILNTVCDKLVINDKYGKKTYYYSSKYSLNADFYKNCTKSNFYKRVKIMNAIYLKAIFEYDDFTVSIEAEKIKQRKLKKRHLEIPRHKVLKEIFW